MMWLFVIVVWVFAPAVELGIIIVLAVVNGNKKRRIEELENRLKAVSGQCAGSPLNAPVTENQAGAITAGQAEAPVGTAKPWIPGKKASASADDSEKKSRWSASSGFSRGTAALVAGVVLVVLAGLIFATTAWHILPDICKAAFVFGFAVLFFTASFLAERFLKIKRTGCAFYILGSLFLMLSVLAVGYFRLFGAEFVLTGYHRWRVLCAGSVVTTAALFGGCSKFRDRVYTVCCLWGVTVSVLLLMLALRLDYRGTACGMMYYGTALLLLRQAGLHRGWGSLRDSDGDERGNDDEWSVGQNLNLFVPMHFGAVSILLAPMLLGDYLSAAVRTDAENRISRWSCGPVDYLASAGYLAVAGCLAAAGCLLVGMAILAWNSKKTPFQMLYQICCIVFFYYGALCLPMDFVCQMSLATIFSGIYFLITRKSGWTGYRLSCRLNCRQGDVLYTAVLAAGTWFLILEALEDGHYVESSLGIQASVTAAAVVFAAVMVWWGRQYPAVRTLIPAELFCLTATVPIIISRLSGAELDTSVFIWIYLLCMMVWDIKKKDRFWAALTVLGAVCQMAYLGEERKQCAFLLLFAGYFFCRFRQTEGRERTWLVRAAAAYFLESVSYLADGLVPGQVVPMLPVLVFLGAGYGLAAGKDRLLEKGDWFWDAAGVVLFVAAMGQFSWWYGYSLWNLIPLLAVFVVLYVKFYRGSGLWQHFVLTLSIIPLPFILSDWYGVPMQHLYGGVLAAVLLSGILMRRCGKLVELSGDGKKPVRVDWYHILIILVLVPMTLHATKIWHFVYLLLLALYVLQFSALPKLRRGAVTTAELLILTAWWTQPFFELPDRLWLEIQVIPVFLIIRLLPAVWGEEKRISMIQRVLDMICLAVLTAGAFVRANVVNALILEGICLTVFIFSHFKKSVWWLKTSGIVMVAVALYMTRSFWLSISWWIYLLTAGLGLIGFAAWNEIRKRGKE